MGWYWQGLPVTIGLMFAYFQSQTNVAAFDISFNIFSDVWPIIFPINELSSFIDAKVSYQRVVVVQVQTVALSNAAPHQRRRIRPDLFSTLL